MIIGGLFVFETITSIDNAIINAEVLRTMKEKARRWFLLWGFIIAVFAVRGLLPWLIVWATSPELGLVGAFTSTFSNDPKVATAIESSAPIILIGGGTFMIFLFSIGFLWSRRITACGRKIFSRERGLVFRRRLRLTRRHRLVRLENKPDDGFRRRHRLHRFFITHGFKQNAEQKEKN